jgi:hypothetical protein
MRITLLMLITSLVPGIALAQASPPPTESSPWEVTAIAGLLSGRPDLPRTDRYQDDWYHAGQGGVILGRYLTTHVKAELELTTSDEGRQYVQQFRVVPNFPQPFSYSSERFARLREISTLVTWQFLENEWVHPFLQAGIGAQFERVRWHNFPQTSYAGNPPFSGSQVLVVPERSEGPETHRAAQGLIGAGAKIYVSQKAFLRTDARFGLSRRGHHTVFRLGVGVDF